MTALPLLPAPREPEYGASPLRELMTAYEERLARELLATEINMSIGQSSADLARAMLETYLRTLR